MVLRGKGHTSVRTLLDGLDAWKNEVLFPVLPQNASDEDRARFERADAVARFLGGQPRAAAAPGSEPQPLAAPALPSVAPPTLPGGGSAPAPRKRKEGC
jgi:hypothetical protein